MSNNQRNKRMYSKFQGDSYYENLVKNAGLLYRNKSLMNFLLKKLDYKGPALVCFILGAIASSVVFLNNLPNAEDPIGLMVNCLIISVFSFIAGFVGTLGYVAYIVFLEKNVLAPSIDEVSNNMELRLSLSNALDKWAVTLEEEKSKIGSEGYSYIYRVSDLIASIQDTSAKLKDAEFDAIKEEVEKVLSGFDSYNSYFYQILHINNQNVEPFGGI